MKIVAYFMISWHFSERVEENTLTPQLRQAASELRFKPETS
jgi:hypothetical protein